MWAGRAIPSAGRNCPKKIRLFSLVFVTAVLYIPGLHPITSGPLKALCGMLFYMGVYTIRAPAAVLIIGAALWLVGFAKDRGN